MEIYIGIKDKNGKKIYEWDRIKQTRWSNESNEGYVGKYKGEWAFLHSQFLTTTFQLKPIGQNLKLSNTDFSGLSAPMFY